ncbi:MAG: hypothetical protein ABSH39_06250 [Candidatus Acidiferrum sp.]
MKRFSRWRSEAGLRTRRLAEIIAQALGCARLDRGCEGGAGRAASEAQAGEARPYILFRGPYR